MPCGSERVYLLEHSHHLTFRRVLRTYWQLITIIHVMAGGKSCPQQYWQMDVLVLLAGAEKSSVMCLQLLRERSLEHQGITGNGTERAVIYRMKVLFVYDVDNVRL
jgi:hypothetical protein